MKEPVASKTDDEEDEFILTCPENGLVEIDAAQQSRDSAATTNTNYSVIELESGVFFNLWDVYFNLFHNFFSMSQLAALAQTCQRNKATVVGYLNTEVGTKRIWAHMFNTVLPYRRTSTFASLEYFYENNLIDPNAKSLDKKLLSSVINHTYLVTENPDELFDRIIYAVLDPKVMFRFVYAYGEDVINPSRAKSLKALDKRKLSLLKILLIWDREYLKLDDAQLECLRDQVDEILADKKYAPFREAVKNCISAMINPVEYLRARNGCETQYLNLSGANLDHADLSRKNCRGVNFSNADCGETNFSGSDLRDTKIYETFFFQANLSGVNLSGVDFSCNNSNVSWVNLNGANLEGATLLLYKLPAFPTKNDLPKFNKVILRETGCLDDEDTFNSFLNHQESLCYNTTFLFAFRGRMLEKADEQTVIKLKEAAMICLLDRLKEATTAEEIDTLWELVAVKDSLITLSDVAKLFEQKRDEINESRRQNPTP